MSFVDFGQPLRWSPLEQGSSSASRLASTPDALTPMLAFGAPLSPFHSLVQTQHSQTTSTEDKDLRMIDEGNATAPYNAAPSDVVIAAEPLASSSSSSRSSFDRLRNRDREAKRREGLKATFAELGGIVKAPRFANQQTVLDTAIYTIRALQLELKHAQLLVPPPSPRVPDAPSGPPSFDLSLCPSLPSSLLQSSSLSVVCWNGSTILEVNPVLCQDLGYRREELVGQSAELIEPKMKDVLCKLLVARMPHDMIATEFGPFVSMLERKDGGVIMRFAHMYCVWERSCEAQQQINANLSTSSGTTNSPSSIPLSDSEEVAPAYKLRCPPCGKCGLKPQYYVIVGLPTRWDDMEYYTCVTLKSCLKVLDPELQGCKIELTPNFEHTGTIMYELPRHHDEKVNEGINLTPSASHMVTRTPSILSSHARLTKTFPQPFVQRWRLAAALMRAAAATKTSPPTLTKTQYAATQRDEQT